MPKGTTLDIVIIDDDEIDREQYKRHIRQFDSFTAVIREASTPTQGLEEIEKKAPDCVLLDHDLPGESGLRVLQILAEKYSPIDFPVIMLTGQDNEALAVKVLNAGAYDYLVKSQVSSNRLVHTIFRAVEQQSLLNKLAEKNKALEKLAYCDSLTGLLNRMAFEKMLSQNLARAKRHHATLAVLFIDLDHFKAVNDSQGHQVGDQLLQEVANRIKAVIREEDLIARIGGDEFALALTEIAHRFNAGDVARKIIEELNKPFYLQETEIRIGASIGIATYPEVDGHENNLLRSADIAMYKAKESRDGRYQYFSSKLNQKYIENMKIENALRFAAERNEFYLVYQPQYDMRNQQVVGLEALLRWRHPEMGDISPAQLIPIAEESGLIRTIGQWVLSSALKQYAEWQKQITTMPRMAINVSAKQLMTRQLFDDLVNILKDTNVSADKIEIELTETTLMSNLHESKKILEMIQALGIYISIDDFGTGYSSLGQLKNNLPINMLKIDKSFMQNVLSKRNDSMIAKAIIDIARNLDLEVIAEGVEQKEQVDFLIDNGCYLAQGFHFSRPLEAEKIKQLLYFPDSNQSKEIH